MNLPESPTKSQMDAIARQIIQSQYKDGVGAITYKRAEGGGVEGKFKDARNPKRVFEFLIKDGSLSYGVDSWDEDDFSESFESIDANFATDQLRDAKGRWARTGSSLFAPASQKVKVDTDPDEKKRIKKEKAAQRLAQNKKEKAKKQLIADSQATLARVAFDNAPEILKKAVVQYGHPEMALPIESQNAFYSGGGKIHMDDTPQDEFDGVYRHEWGHHYDYELGKKAYAASSPEDKKAFDLDTTDWNIASEDTFVSSSPKGKKAFEADNKSFTPEKLKAAIDTASDDHKTLAYLADIAGCLTNNKHGFGHSDDYLKDPRKGKTEVFANIISLVGSGNRQNMKAAITLAPNMFDFVMTQLTNE